MRAGTSFETGGAGPSTALAMESPFLLFAAARTSEIESDYAILSATVLVILRAANFTGSDPTAYFFPLEEVKSITSLPAVDKPSRAGKEVFIFFSADGSRAGDKDFILLPSLATSSIMAIG